MKRFYFVLLLISFLLILTSCGKENKDKDKVKDIEFTLVPESDLPDNLKTIINQRKANEFQLTYGVDGTLYLVVGYGERNTSGFSIQVLNCYQTKTDIVFETELVGPSEQDMVSTRACYPYIVVKIEYLDLPVIFR